MAVAFGWAVRTAMAAFVVALTTAIVGCSRNAPAIEWVASGIQVMQLDLPLSGDGDTFTVREYVLEGQAASDKGLRQFRDCLLLTSHLSGGKGEVLGYMNRTYDDGTKRALRLLGRMERPPGNPEAMIVNGRTYLLQPEKGASESLKWVDMVQLRLDPASGRISAKGS